MAGNLSPGLIVAIVVPVVIVLFAFIAGFAWHLRRIFREKSHQDLRYNPVAGELAREKSGIRQGQAPRRKVTVKQQNSYHAINVDIQSGSAQTTPINSPEKKIQRSHTDHRRENY